MNLIHEILDLAKIELEIGPVHFPVLLNDVKAIIQVQSDAKNLKFIYETEDLPDGILADEKRLRQVLLNLLASAVKSTEKGEVTFRVKAEAVPGDKNEIRIYFTIIDTGNGIPPDRLHEVFEPFEQMHSVLTQVEGTGPGLSITRNLIEKMGGSVHLGSKLENNQWASTTEETPIRIETHGTAIWFSLDFPVTKIESTANPVQIKEGRIVGVKGRSPDILLVDDNVDSRALMLRILKRRGLQVREAMDGRAAISMVYEKKPDLIITDLHMPGMGGHELIQSIREIPEFQGIKIITSSADVTGHTQEESAIPGSDAFLLKPVHYNDLYKTLEELLNLEWLYEAKGEVSIDLSK